MLQRGTAKKKLPKPKLAPLRDSALESLPNQQRFEVVHGAAETYENQSPDYCLTGKPLVIQVTMSWEPETVPLSLRRFEG
jgi:hypothetical protein